MSEQIDTGGPAYPWANESSGADGMTLLDYFAGEVLKGQYASQSDSCPILEKHFDSISRKAYSQAAAMVAEKRRREQPAGEKE